MAAEWGRGRWRREEASRGPGSEEAEPRAGRGCDEDPPPLPAGDRGRRTGTSCRATPTLAPSSAPTGPSSGSTASAWPRTSASCGDRRARASACRGSIRARARSLRRRGQRRRVPPQLVTAAVLGAGRRGPDRDRRFQRRLRLTPVRENPRRPLTTPVGPRRHRKPRRRLTADTALELAGQRTKSGSACSDGAGKPLVDGADPRRRVKSKGLSAPVASPSRSGTAP